MRRAALDVLEAVRRGRRLDRAFREAPVEGRDRRWVHELVYGVERFRGRLDARLDSVLDRGLVSLRGELPDILRAGAYELLFRDGTPGYAAVSSWVEEARTSGGEGAAKLANAVLRRVQREADPEGEPAARFPDPQADPIGYLSQFGSHPRWMVERWVERWGFESTRLLVEANNRIPATYLRPYRLSLADAVARLADVGIEATPEASGTPLLRLAEGTSPADALLRVSGVIQDPAAALVVEYADVAQGSLVADLCAAPGGKTVGLAERARRVVACDRSGRRLRLLNDTRERLGAPIDLLVARAEDPALSAADLVLVDVPCTGTGTLRRHPDARWRRTLEDVRSLATVQQSILGGAARVVPPGGVLVYSTCSLEYEENQEQVEWFRTRYPDFSLEASETVAPRFLNAQGCLEVLPQETGFDGAFAARFRRG